MRRKILPVYKFTDNDDFFSEIPYPVYVEAHQWMKINTHPHDGGLFKIVKPYLTKFKERGDCEDCEHPIENPGAMKIKDVVEKVSWIKICPGDWILLNNNEHWPCPDYLFHEIYKITPKREWYENLRCSSQSKSKHGLQ